MKTPQFEANKRRKEADAADERKADILALSLITVLSICMVLSFF